MLVVCMCNITFDSMTRSHQYSMCPEKSKYPFEICCSAHSLSRELLPQWRSLHPGSAPWLPSSRKMAHFGCLDPTDLNQAIQQEHYPLSTIEDVATLLHEAKIFTILDVCKGLLHIEQDEPSSFLTTPFGWYRWKRMPSGISSALVYWEWFNISANSSLRDLLQSGPGTTSQDSRFCSRSSGSIAANRHQLPSTVGGTTLKRKSTLQCDASQVGLSAALMQNKQPVAYASRALKPGKKMSYWL